MADKHLSLFDEWELPDDRPATLRHAQIEYRDSGSILTPASGFMGDYDFTLNPYSGCELGCTYCYAAFFSRDKELQDSWGRWVVVKKNAVQKLKGLRRDIRDKKIYMSSVTDPYQGIEAKIGMVRAILEEIIPKQPRLVVQTRSPLVTRDIDLYQKLDHVQVNMTVTTDSETIRKAFEPDCPTISARLKAITKVAAAGIRCGITMTPLLPIENPINFAQQLIDTGVPHFVAQQFHSEKGRFVAGTRQAAMEVVQNMNWDEEKYNEVFTILREQLPNLIEGRDGFAPI